MEGIVAAHVPDLISPNRLKGNIRIPGSGKTLVFPIPTTRKLISVTIGLPIASISVHFTPQIYPRLPEIIPKWRVPKTV